MVRVQEQKDFIKEKKRNINRAFFSFSFLNVNGTHEKEKKKEGREGKRALRPRCLNTQNTQYYFYFIFVSNNFITQKGKETIMYTGSGPDRKQKKNTQYFIDQL